MSMIDGPTATGRPDAAQASGPSSRPSPMPEALQVDRHSLLHRLAPGRDSARRGLRGRLRRMVGKPKTTPKQLPRTLDAILTHENAVPGTLFRSNSLTGLWPHLLPLPGAEAADAGSAPDSPSSPVVPPAPPVVSNGFTARMPPAVQAEVAAIMGWPAAEARHRITNLPAAAEGGLQAAAARDLTAAFNYRGHIEADADRIQELAAQVENNTASPEEKTELSQTLRRHLDALGIIQSRLEAHSSHWRQSGGTDHSSPQVSGALWGVGLLLADTHQGLADLYTHLSDSLPETAPGTQSGRIAVRVAHLKGMREGVSLIYQRFQSDVLSHAPRQGARVLADPRVQAIQRVARDIDADIASLESRAQVHRGDDSAGNLHQLLAAPETSGGTVQDTDELAHRLTAILHGDRDGPVADHVGATETAVRLALDWGQSLTVGQGNWEHTNTLVPGNGPAGGHIFASQMMPGGGPAIQQALPEGGYQILGRFVKGIRAGERHQFLHAPNLALSTLSEPVLSASPPQPGPPIYVGLRHGFLDAPGMTETLIQTYPKPQLSQIESDLASDLPPGMTGDDLAGLPASERAAALRDASASHMAREVVQAHLAIGEPLADGANTDVTVDSIALLPAGGAGDGASGAAWRRQQQAFARLENGGQPVAMSMRQRDGTTTTVQALIHVRQAAFEKTATGWRPVDGAAMLTPLLGERGQPQIGGAAGVQIARLDREIAALDGALGRNQRSQTAFQRWLDRRQPRPRSGGFLSVFRRRAPPPPRLAEIPQRLPPQTVSRMGTARAGFVRERGALISLAGDLKRGWRRGADRRGGADWPARLAVISFLSGSLPAISCADGMQQTGLSDAAAKHLAGRALTGLPVRERDVDSRWRQAEALFRARNGDDSLRRANEGLSL